VIAAVNKGQVMQDKIIHPGPAFPHPSAYQVGILLKFQEIFFDGRPNTFDAAVAWTKPQVAHFGHHHYTIDNRTDIAVPGMLVKKEGATTGPTNGVVRVINFAFNMPYGSNGGPPSPATSRQIVIEGTDGPNRPFSLRGDSGSPGRDAGWQPSSGPAVWRRHGARRPLVHVRQPDRRRPVRSGHQSVRQHG
jgi:hypothetical protein